MQNEGHASDATAAPENKKLGKARFRPILRTFRYKATIIIICGPLVAFY